MPENYTRTINVRVELIQWDWSVSKIEKRDSDPINLTADGSVKNYRFQKSIKTPKSTAQITLIPQRSDTNLLDIINVMDVIRIYEFDILKFQGYVRRVSYSGSIAPIDGKPNREVIVTVEGFGALLLEAEIGLGLGRAMGNATALIESAARLRKGIADAMDAGFTYGIVLKTLVDEWFDFVERAGSSAFRTYIDTYMNFVDGIDVIGDQLLPRSFDLYTGAEESLNFWTVAQQIAELPLNDLFVDNGPRAYARGSEHSDTLQIIQAPKDLTYVIFREPLFDRFNAHDYPHFLQKKYITRFDLSKSMDEVYSVYAALPAAFSLNEIIRTMLGEITIDAEAVNKYLYRPLINQLFYTRIESKNENKADVPTSEIRNAAQETSDRLYGWFKNNDRYYSGAITYMVPDENDVSLDDPRIGNKMKVEGIEGRFYSEGISHTWAYGGALTGTVSVTRGWNYRQDEQMKFTDVLFKGGAF